MKVGIIALKTINNAERDARITTPQDARFACQTRLVRPAPT